MYLFVDENVQKQIKNRNIQYLFHFTDINNIDSILNMGLYSVAELKKKGISYCNTDELRYDGKTECLSLSIEFPNYMYLQSLKEKFGNRYVIIRFRVECIFERVIIIHKSNPHLPRWGIAQNFNDLFFDEHRFHLLPIQYPTDPRAELQINSSISSDYIDTIYYPTDFCEKNKIMVLQQKHTSLCFSENDYYFNERIDYEHWRIIRKNGIDVFKV